MWHGPASLEIPYLYGVYQLLMDFLHGWTSVSLTCTTCCIPCLGKQLAIQEWAGLKNKDGMCSELGCREWWFGSTGEQLYLLNHPVFA